jgi:L-fucose isomerase-like protein
LQNKFQYIALSSPIGDRNQIKKIIKDYQSNLEAIGGIEITEENFNENLPLFFFIVTGGTEQAVLKVILKHYEKITKQPIWLIAHSGNNSFPASLEILAKIKQENGNGKIFYLNSHDDKNGLDNLFKAVNILSVRNELRNSRIGLIGGPSEWLIASSPDSETIGKYWGLKIIEIAFSELENNIANTTADNTISAELKSSAHKIFEPQSADLNEAGIVYLALSKLILQNQLDAVAVKCFDLLTKNSSTGCFALSKLNDEGIIAGCEGDLVSTIGMLWANKLTGKLCWMANPSRIDSETNSLILAHCTVPRKMIKNYNLRSHFESGLGVGIEGEFVKDSVTLFRIGGKDMNKLWVAEGCIVSNDRADNLCRTQVKIKLNDKHKLEELISNPLGNHLLMIDGKHQIEFENYWNFIFFK